MSFFPKHELKGTNCVLKIAMITLLRMQPTIFSPELVVIPTRKMIRESRASSKKNLDVQKCCVSVAKHIVVMISILISTSLAAKDSTKEHWKTVAMVDQYQNIAKCWRNLLMYLQPIEDFGRFSIVLLRMKRERKDYLTFIQKE